MKSLVTLLITVFASAAFAGGSGGGGVMMNNFMVRPDRAFEFGGAGGGGGVRPGAEIVFHMGQENGVVKFAYGQLDGSQWRLQKLAISAKELALDTAAISALEKSKQSNSWVTIK